MHLTKPIPCAWLFTIAIFALAVLLPSMRPAAAQTRPNIVWIVGEDMGPDMGCYGDDRARTPSLDTLASQGARFTHAFTHAPVCAPARHGLITGMYPTTTGAHHMRSKLLDPPETFTSILRRHGYYTAWPGKTDFNFDMPEGWVDTTSDWLNNPPRQPFFAYINITLPHESQTRNEAEAHARNTRALKPEDRVDPATVKLPPFYPDTPAVRGQIAQYYELVTALDYRVGDILAKLKAHGLEENTIIIFFGDHGRGHPRYKRWVYDTGIHVPLVVRWPGKIRPGSVREDLVSFVDFAPTVLALAGVPIPEQMQGQPFLSADSAENPSPRKHIFAARDRMDETYDRIRAVRDHRYKYIRNFHPELPYAQQIQYNELNPIMRDWRAAHRQGTLSGPQALFWAESKPREELYDTQADPWELNNLAQSPDPAMQAKLRELRAALDQWMEQTKDLGAVPETELIRRGLVKDVLIEYEKRKESHTPQ